MDPTSLVSGVFRWCLLGYKSTIITTDTISNILRDVCCLEREVVSSPFLRGYSSRFSGSLDKNAFQIPIQSDKS